MGGDFEAGVQMILRRMRLSAGRLVPACLALLVSGPVVAQDFAARLGRTPTPPPAARFRQSRRPARARRRAARRLPPADRTFNHRPELVVRFTNDPEVLAGGVAAITAEGGTALYDSLIYALYYFSGINGKRAVLLLSDGADEGSRYSFDEALDYARRTGVAIYAIGIGLGGSRAVQTRLLLQRLADETGGRSFFVNGAGDLGRVYEDIEGELRTQSQIAYQSSAAGGDGTFREVEVEVGVSGAEAKTIRGYFP
jgi:VWFA-related protein